MELACVKVLQSLVLVSSLIKKPKRAIVTLLHKLIPSRNFSFNKGPTLRTPEDEDEAIKNIEEISFEDEEGEQVEASHFS